MDFSLNLGKCFFSFSVTEIEEEHLPSFKVELNLIIHHPSGRVTYSASNMWFENCKWNLFEKNARDYTYGKSDKISLNDMSSYFILKIYKVGNKTSLEISIFEPDTGNGEINIFYKSLIDHEEVFRVKKSTADFHKWW